MDPNSNGNDSAPPSWRDLPGGLQLPDDPVDSPPHLPDDPGASGWNDVYVSPAVYSAEVSRGKKGGWRRPVAAVALAGTLVGGAFAALRSGGSEKSNSPVAAATTPIKDDATPISAETTTPKDALETLREEVLSTPEYTFPDVVLARTRDLNKDPLYRASSITLYGASPDYKTGGMGSAGLVEQNGVLSLQTIEHVPKGFAEDGVKDVYAIIPGVGSIKVGMPVVDDKHAEDGVSTIALSEPQQKLLAKEAENGMIKPLEVSRDVPKVGDTYQIASPETGKTIEITYLLPRGLSLGNLMDPAAGEGMFVVTKYNDESLYADGDVSNSEFNGLMDHLKAGINVAQIQDMLCQGFSGSLVTEVGHPERSPGSLSVAVPMYDEKGRQCGLAAGIRLYSEAFTNS